MGAKDELQRHISHSVISWHRSLFLGMGLAYTIENNKYWELPVVILFPTVYSGYQLFKHRNSLLYTLKQ